MTKKELHAYKMRMAELRIKALQQVAKGCCPQCGAGIHSNSALTGWFQCDRSGSEGFRKDVTGKHCDWQVFTE